MSLISETEILEKVLKTEITPKMERAIRTQCKAFFPNSEDYVIDYVLYDNVKDYKSFNTIEKAKIAYETLSRLYAGVVFNLGFLDNWADEVREYLEESEAGTVEDSSNVNKCEKAPFFSGSI